ncbi:hypothetical protein [Nostoc sp.]|uniref:hypothetical protein n=1 Tax=Nostoc sp. TaxID=1180 RepID=UPI002FFBF68E
MHFNPLPLPRGYGVELPPLIPPIDWWETGNLVPSPIDWGGLGCGKTLVNQLFQTCVYTVVTKGRGDKATLWRGAVKRL